MDKAKIFQSGNSQAIRLPKKFRFKGNEVGVFILGNGLVLQPLNKTWIDVRNSMKGLDDADFAAILAMEDFPLEEREMF